MDDRSMSMSSLEDALVALGPRLAFPAEPELAGRVRTQIESARVPARRRMPSWRPAFAVATILVATTAALLVFSPTTREAVADWIGLDGVRITFGDEPKARPAEKLAEGLALGDRVTLEEAAARMEFEIEVLGALGDPDEVYVVEDDPPGGRVALVYEAAEGLPRADQTGVGALFSQFRATYEDVTEKKVLDAGGTLEIVEVDGARGYWLGGGPHSIAYLDAEGEVRTDQVRLAGNTLLWQRDGIVFRLETALSRDAAIELAESAR